MREIKFKFLMENGEVTDSYYLKELIDSDSYISIESEYSSRIKQEIQYTGLKDKNGVEIYEGDIVSIMDCEPSLYKICYWDNNFKWAVEYTGKDKTNWQSDNLEEFSSEDFEILGNIYENPELLEVKEQ